jgi:hypothetical protein
MNRVLYHYTNESGLAGILKSKTLLPSTRARNPKDARYGDGQYMTDIAPGAKRLAQLSRIFLGHPWAGPRFSHRVDIQVGGLTVVFGRANVFVILNTGPLDIKDRLVGYGRG